MENNNQTCINQLQPIAWVVCLQGSLLHMQYKAFIYTLTPKFAILSAQLFKEFCCWLDIRQRRFITITYI